MKYDFTAIEKKWQAKWLEEKPFTAVNGDTIDSSDALVSFIKNCEVDDELTLTIYRQGETLERTLTVGQQTQPAIAQNDGQAVQQSQSQQNGTMIDPWSFFRDIW